MSELTKIDPNLATKTASGGTFSSIDEPPFTLYGLFKDEKGYFRFPPEIAEKVSDGVAYLNRQTAGGMVRFRTNSPSLAVSAKKPGSIDIMGHMAPMSSCGFDMYSGTTFLGGFVPPQPFGGEYTSERELCTAFCEKDEDGFFEVTMYLPTYGVYNDIGIKAADGYEIRPAKPFRNQKPVVFYGSSITQGGCSSSAGGSFVNMISRMLDLYCINLGFSGSAKAEPAMCEYLAELEMSAFVMDYDHNAPDSAHLEHTHFALYETVRKAKPDLPIIIASSVPVLTPSWQNGDAQGARREIIRATYQKAVAAGDKNVYFLDGCEFFEDVPFDYCTVDGVHPNTLGMYQMAKGFGSVLKQLDLEK